MKIDTLLAEKFDIAEEDVAPAPLPVVVSAAPLAVGTDTSATQSTLETDTDKARTTLSALIDKSTIALDEMMNVANNSEEPRAYEVVAQLIKTMADISKDLVQVHKMSRDASPADSAKAKSSTNVQNQNIYVGTTADLIRMMKGGPVQEIEANATIERV